MNVLGWITDLSSTLPVGLIWALGASISFAESGVGLGLVFPGETAILIVSAALTSPWSAVVMAVLVTIAACAGDHVGYLIGRRYGSRLRSSRIVRRFGVQHWDRSIALLEKQGARAILFTRPVPVVRILTPAAAGVAGSAYPRFFAASFSGAAIWSVLYVGLGYLLRSSLDAVEKSLNSFGWVVGAILLVAVALAVVRHLRKKKRERAGEPAPATADIGLQVRRVLARARQLSVPGGRIAFAAVFVAGVTASWFWVALAGSVGLLVATLVRPRQAPATGVVRRALRALDAVSPALLAGSLALGHLVPWSVAGALALPLTGLALLSDRPLPGIDVSRSRLRRLLIDAALASIVVGIAIPALRPVIPLGMVTLFAGIILLYAEAVRVTRSTLAPRAGT